METYGTREEIFCSTLQSNPVNKVHFTSCRELPMLFDHDQFRTLLDFKTYFVVPYK